MTGDLFGGTHAAFYSLCVVIKRGLHASPQALEMQPTWTLALWVFLSVSRGGLAWAPDGDFMAAAGPLAPDACPLPALLPRHLGSLRARGVTHYKVFLSWARLLPAGGSAAPDADALRCHRRLLRAVRAAGLRPLGVLHRGRLPGPGPRGEAPADRFADYAAFAFRSFGDLVDTWFTFSDLREAIAGPPRREAGPAVLQALAAAHRKAYEVFHGQYAPPGEPATPTAGTAARVTLRSPPPPPRGPGAPSHSVGISFIARRGCRVEGPPWRGPGSTPCPARSGAAAGVSLPPRSPVLPSEAPRGPEAIPPAPSRLFPYAKRLTRSG